MSVVFNWPLVGQENAVKFLQSAIVKNKLSHAYLFHGISHLGKTTIAQYFAKSIFCHNSQSSATIPCDHCDHCRQFDHHTHPDLTIVKRLVDKKEQTLNQNISIEQIRELRDKIYLSSFLKNYKIIIIEEADKLNRQAANALLKILEEPSAKTIFILLASNLKNLPATVVSRCQQLKFYPLAFAEVYKYLVNVKKINRNTALDLAAIVQGRVGLIDYYLTDDHLKDYYSELENQVNLLTQPIYQRFLFINDKLSVAGTTQQSKEIVLQLFTQWEVIIRIWLLRFNQLPVLTNQLVNKLIDNLSVKQKDISNQKLVNLLVAIKTGREYLYSNVNPKLILENFLLKF